MAGRGSSQVAAGGWGSEPAAGGWGAAPAETGGWGSEPAKPASNGWGSQPAKAAPAADDGWGSGGDSAWASGGGGGGFSSGGSSSGCRNCGKDGHFARECPEPKKGGSGCRNCGQEGHFSRECTEPKKPQGACHKCGEEGHFSRECLQGGGGGGGGGSGCRNCGQDGHFAKECTEPKKAQGACHKCGEEGHFSRECPQGGGGDSTCRNCGKDGHFAKDCTEERDPSKPAPVTYIPDEQDESEAGIFDETTTIRSGINFEKYNEIAVDVSGGQGAVAPLPIQEFTLDLLRDSLMANIKRTGYDKPTPVQKYALPILLGGFDLMACAQTGSGKTAAFVLPILQQMLVDGYHHAGEFASALEPTCLVLSPTRELCVQIHNQIQKFAYGTMIKSALCYGGVSTRHQKEEGIRRGCTIVVGCTGRICDFLERKWLSLEHTRFLVLDEADRMLDMGFAPNVDVISKYCKPQAERQTLMFSATFPDEIQTLAMKMLKPDYIYLAVGVVGGANQDVTQTILEVSSDKKFSTLTDILKGEEVIKDPAYKGGKVLVFVEMKKTADSVGALLSTKGFMSSTMHGDRMQSEREEALRMFRQGKTPVLIATSVAARGLDITGVGHVINYDLPKEKDEYVHRIGRTGRAGNMGKATSFYDPGKDSALARPLMQCLEMAKQKVPSFLEGSSGFLRDSGALGGDQDIRHGVGNMKMNGGGAAAGGFEEDCWD